MTDACVHHFAEPDWAANEAQNSSVIYGVRSLRHSVEFHGRHNEQTSHLSGVR